MVGGYWATQNKVRPGAYINFETSSIAGGGVDSRGPVAIPLALDWGEPNTITKVTPNTRFKETFGKELKDLLPIREALKGSAEILVFNLSGDGGEKATATSGTFTATAFREGEDGNKLTVIVTLGLDGGATVRTFFEGTQVDVQSVEGPEALEANSYVEFTGDFPTEDVTLTLEGGVTGATTNDSYANFAAALDSQNFKTVAIGSEDESVKSLMSAKVKHWIENEGKNVVFVTNNFNEADHESTTSILNGVYLEGNEFLSAADAVYFYAAAFANAGTTSLTYNPYPGAVDCERLSHEEIVQALKDGHIVFTYQRGMDGVDRVVIEQDINTFRTFTSAKNQDFRKNKIVRSMHILGDNVKHIWATTFIGSVNNDEDGRDLFKASVMTNVLDPLVNAGAMEAYEADDIVVSPGVEKDAVVATVAVTFTDAMEKLYMTVNCQ